MVLKILSLERMFPYDTRILCLCFHASCFVFFLICAVGLLGTAATYWPIVPAPDDRWWMVIVEKLVKWRLAEETEVLGENVTQRHFVHHKPHMTRPGFESGPPRWEASN
jgi:hypothetical protein